MILWLVLSLIIAIQIVLIIKFSHLIPDHKHILLFLGLTLLVCELYANYRLYESKNIGKMYTMLKGLSIVIVYLLGVLLFEENYTKWSIVGILLIIVGILII